MSDPVLEEKRNGFILKIYPDEIPINPIEEFEPLGTYAFYGKRSHLGNFKEYREPEEIAWYIKNNRSLAWALYHNEQSGELTMGNLVQFDLWWNMGGHVGWVFIPRDKILREYNAKILHRKLKQRIEGYIHAEVAQYSAYLSGQVYYYVLEDEKEETIDSCSGYDGYKACEEKALGALEHHIDVRFKAPGLFKEVPSGS